MEDEQFLQMFLDESEDQITTINQNLLDLEQDPSDLDSISEMFRMAHSMKGAAASMGFNNITTLTHRMETLLDKFRSGELELDSDYIDVFFECLDMVEALVNEIQQSGTDTVSIDAILSRLNSAETPTPPQPETEPSFEPARSPGTENTAVSPIKTVATGPSPRILGSMHIEDLEEIRHQVEAGNRIIEVSFEIDEAEGMAGTRALITKTRLQEIGDVLANHPDPESDEADNFTFFNFLIATDAEKDEILETTGSVGIKATTFFSASKIVNDLINEAATREDQSKVLIIGDSKYQRFKMKKILEKTGHEVHEAADPIDGLYMYRRISPDIVLLDLIMPNMEGLDALKYLRKIDHEARVIMYSALDNEEIAIQAMKSGAKDYLIKLSDVDTTIQKINSAMNQ